ncbi:hypothetical protein CRE_08492 [Caenorhabditis remanei]|uniref:Tyr recombinase domain-containing protein n=1 Tax=Caenorhabditis remanei TaxID=31234 RepID=E3N6X0_CAERE|nr:hypothetical protein CRE_08492 [Caenorhabditis remanei]
MLNSLGPGNLVKAIEFLARVTLEGKAPSTARDYFSGCDSGHTEERSADEAKPKAVSWSTLQIVAGTKSNDEKGERDTLILLLSYQALLRAEEAANLKWSDLTQNLGNPSAKSKERSTCTRSKHVHSLSGRFEFGLSSQAMESLRIFTIEKERGAANDLQRQGFSKEEIKARGRWRSDAGLKSGEVGAEEETDGPPVLVRQPEG